LSLYYKSTVGDNKGRIVETLRRAVDRSDLVLTTGGIGPTLDDMTRESVAEVLGVPLEMHPNLLEQIKAMMGSRYTDNNARQAYVPADALPIKNPVGTAPIFVAPTPHGGAVVCFPGVPGELRYLMENAVLPHLKERFQVQSVLVSRTLKCLGLTESYIDEALDDLIQEGSNPTIGLLAQMQLGEIHVRLTAKAADETAAATLLDPLEAAVRQRLGKAVYGRDAVEYDHAVADLLRQHDLTIAVAESGMSGGVGHELGSALARITALLPRSWRITRRRWNACWTCPRRWSPGTVSSAPKSPPPWRATCGSATIPIWAWRSPAPSSFGADRKRWPASPWPTATTP
jgi:nicotinamide-nucleotide amidase